MVLGASYHREKIPSPSASAESNKGTPKRRAKKVCTRYWISPRRIWEEVDGHLVRSRKPALLRWCPERRERYKRNRMCGALSVCLLECLVHAQILMFWCTFELGAEGLGLVGCVGWI